MQKVLQNYLRRLTNLTGSNRSLMLLNLRSSQFLDVHSFHFSQNEPSFNIIAQLMGRSRTIDICSVNDPRDEVSNQLSSQVRKLQRIERFIEEEQGSRDLFVGWPFVRGKFSDGTPVRCPLMFFPVEIGDENGSWVLKQREEVNTTLNKSFLLAFSYFNKVKLAEDLLERVFDDFDTDSTVFRTALYQLFKESPIDINFNSEIFSDHLHTFQSYSKKDYEEETKLGELKLFPEAVLGIFPQAGSQLVTDYLDLIENDKIPDIEEFFVERSSDDATDSDFLDKVKEETIVSPFWLDVYQENALKATKKGHSLVVQGPPGTGKSQLICNLISDGVASGKRILLVSQKRAALDVVFDRLEEIGLSDSIGLVHDFKNDRKQLYKKLQKQIDRIPEFVQKNNSLDTIQLERTFQQSSRSIDRLSEELSEFKFALFDESECGLSAKELYLTSDRVGESINLKQEYKDITFDSLKELKNKLLEYLTYAKKFSSTSYLLNNRMSFSAFGLSDLKTMLEILEDIPKLQKQLGDAVEGIIGARIDLDECVYLYDREETINQIVGVTKNKKVYKYLQSIFYIKEKETADNWLQNIERIVLDCFKAEGVEASTDPSELGKIHDALERAMVAGRSPFGFLAWRLFSKDKFFLKRVLVANNLKGNRKGIRTLATKIDNRLNLEHNLSLLREKKWLLDIPKDNSKLSFQSWFHLQKEAIRLKDQILEIRNFKEYFVLPNLNYPEFREKIEKLFRILQEIPAKRSFFLQYLTASQISSITQDNNLAAQLIEVLKRDFDALCEFDKLTESFTKSESSIIKKLELVESSEDETELVTIFDNSLRLAWIDHIETKYPILRSTASQKFHKLISELQQAVETKQDVARDILLLKVRERTYENAEYNRLQNMVTYRDLYHQVTKKRRIWPLRKSVTHFYDEIFNLTPCWMMSPEAVSAIFPMEQIFDIVIFDEASQCFSERGIPAMYRGRQTIIAGDRMQLRPNDLYQIRWDEEHLDEDVQSSSTENFALEADSLLDLASPFLLNISLNGHYRSRSLDLIDFSNEHFYDGRLSFLPDKNVVDLNEPSIDYIKVGGVWESNVNHEEAIKVVDLVIEITNQSPDKTIGVVTFNAKQQYHILDFLERQFVEKELVIPENLFVKNIENVQGDERDIIIFSTAYAPDSKGKLVMQFGSLNAEGGENRLNVAITRAREKISLVTSISPDELKVEDSKNEGPKLLKKYLTYALEVSQGNHKPYRPKLEKHSEDWYLQSKIIDLYKDDEELILTDEMPFVDVTVKSSNDSHLGLIVTDDNHYYSSKSIKAPHVYNPHTYSLKNWRFKEVFSREYWSNPEGFKENLTRFISHSK